MLFANENSSFLDGDASLSVTASVRGYPGNFAGFRECSRDSVNVRDICKWVPTIVRGFPLAGIRERSRSFGLIPECSLMPSHGSKCPQGLWIWWVSNQQPQE